MDGKSLERQLIALKNTCEGAGFTAPSSLVEIFCIALRAAKVWPSDKQWKAVIDLINRAIGVMVREDAKDGMRLLRAKADEEGQLIAFASTGEEVRECLIAVVFAALQLKVGTEPQIDVEEITGLRTRLATESARADELVGTNHTLSATLLTLETQCNALRQELEETQATLAERDHANEVLLVEMQELRRTPPTLELEVPIEPSELEIENEKPSTNGHGGGNGNGVYRPWQQAALWIQEQGSAARDISSADIATRFGIQGANSHSTGVTISYIRKIAAKLAQGEIITFTSLDKARRLAYARQ